MREHVHAETMKKIKAQEPLKGWENSKVVIEKKEVPDDKEEIPDTSSVYEMRIDNFRDMFTVNTQL